MAKRKNEDVVAPIKKLIGSDKLIIGTDRALKAIKQGKLQAVYLAKNCAEETEKQISKYCQLAGISLIKLDYLNENMGTICKKPFSVSVIGVVKE